MTSLPDLALAADFPDATGEQWRALVDHVLKGGSFERLVSTTYDGIEIQPLYTAGDLRGTPEQFPGQPNFTRGERAEAPEGGAWAIRQTALHPDPTEANRRLLEDLDGGVSSVALRLDAGGAGLVDGVIVGGQADLDALLDGVLLDLVSVVVEAGPASPAAAMLIAAWDERGLSVDSRRGSLGADPLGALASTGRLGGTLPEAFDDLADLVTRCAAWPNVRAIDVDTAAYADAGAGEAEELALMVATGVEYLRELAARRVEIDVAARQIGFTLAADTDVFATIAKFRAARRLWSHAVAAAGAPDASGAPFAARTATRMMTRRDPWVNMLRTTAACFAAGAGGASAVTVQPFDAAVGPADALARRLARNTQLILQEESHVGAVVDPAGGSWYIERFTDELTDRAWSRFVEIEAAGGMSAVLLDGSEHAALSEIRSKRSTNIARRRDALTGVSEFPNLTEVPLARNATDVEQRRADARAAWAAGPHAAAARATSTVIRPLGAHRLAEDFEALRDASDGLLRDSGSRPRAFLANLGPVAVHTGRASFAKNFFEAGGVETIGNDGFADDEALGSAFAASGCEVAVLCSSDAVYAERAESAAKALVAAGARRVYLAGKPGEERERFESAGISGFVHVGTDVPATVTELLEFLGVAR